MKAKYIQSLHATNIGKFNILNVDFNPRFNFIVGANGCGKTTLLKTIAVIFNPEEASTFRYGKESEIWIDCVISSTVNRIGLDKGWVEQGNDYRKARLLWYKEPPLSTGIHKSFSVSNIEDMGIGFVPAFYGAYRRISYHTVDGMKRENSPVENRRFYKQKAIDCIEGGFLPDVKQWMVNRYYMYGKEWAANYKENWLWLIDNLKIISPFYDQFSFKEIRQDLEPIFTLNGKDCYLEELSAGFQAVLSLIFGIINWIEAVNEQDNILIKDATGTVIIDELDAHLHPEWQLIIRDAFEKLFPQLQFIVTTHSPHLIASAKQGEIIKIPINENVVNVKATSQVYSGWSTEEILEDVMEVKGLENKALALIFKDAMNAIESKDINELKNIIEKLKAIVHPNNIMIETLQIKLAELMLVNSNDSN